MFYSKVEIVWIKWVKDNTNFTKKRKYLKCCWMRWKIFEYFQKYITIDFVYKNTSQGKKFLSFLVPSSIFCKSPDICDKSHQPSLLGGKFTMQCAYFTREIFLVLGSCLLYLTGNISFLHEEFWWSAKKLDENLKYILPSTAVWCKQACT